MRILVIGAVAGGTSAAAKARRNHDDAEIVIYEKGAHISYAGCSMPYYLGGVIQASEDIIPRDPKFFKDKYNINVLIEHEVLEVIPERKEIIVKNHSDNQTFTDHYDQLIIATGARATVPPIKNADQNHVFTLRNIQDMFRIQDFLNKEKPKHVAIIGSGFIGLEMCENFKKIGLDITLLERLPQVTPGLDADVAIYVESHLREKGINVIKEASVTEIKRDSVVLDDGRTFPAELVLVAAGIRPNTEIAEAAGIKLGVANAIQVDAQMRTNVDGIYACGDCIEHVHVITGEKVYRPLGSTANKTGRIAGANVTGDHMAFRGVLGTGIFRVFDLAVAQTGLSEREAKESGYDVEVIHHRKISKPEYMGGQEMFIKAVADRRDERLLGVQIVGGEGVDKRIDVFVTAITHQANAEDLFHLDLAYSPPFSTTKDPVMYTGMILDNAIEKGRPIITPEELDELMASDEKVIIIDTRVEAQFDEEHISQAMNIPHERFRETCENMDKDVTVVTYCNMGTTGNATQNILLNKGFKKAYNLSGGHKHYKVVHPKKPE